MSTRPINPVLAARQQQNPSLQQRAERPVTCPRCGSTWFREAEFRQYSNLLFGSGAGADLRVIGNTMQTIRVCLCGYPITPNLSGVRGKTATAEGKDFMTSLKQAQDYLEQPTGGTTADLDAVVDQLATRGELQAKADTIKADTDAIKADVGSLRTTLSGFKENLKQALVELNQELAELRQRQPETPNTAAGDTDADQVPEPRETEQTAPNPKSAKATKKQAGK